MSPATPVSTQPSLPEWLHGLAGVDVLAALVLCGGDRSLYRRVLEVFTREHGGDPALLRATLAAADRPELRRLAHALKGVAGTIGAKGLMARAHALETSARNPVAPWPILDALTQALALDLEHLTERLAARLAQAAEAERSLSPGAQPDTKPIAAEVMAQLKTGLAEGDLEIVNFARQHSSVWVPLLGPQATAFSNQVERLDFEAALRLIQAL